MSRVYGAVGGQSDWQVRPGYRLMHAGTGKNAADLLLSVDAMELALVGGIGGFVVATSDGDFMHLAQRLRERGLTVIGLGESKAPERFRAACTDFVPLPVQPCAQPVATSGPAPTSFDRKIRAMITEHSQHGRGIRMTDLAAKMRKTHDIQIRNHQVVHGVPTCRIAPRLYDLDPRGPEAHIRYRPEGFTS